MLNRFASILLSGVLSGVGATALAQTPPVAQAPAVSTTMAPVTVQAVAKPKVVEKQTQTFVQSYAAASNPELGQIGRWREAVCVQVEGLPQADQAAVIKARIESVAQAVGLPAARGGCRANVEIVFTDQPQATMDVVAKRRQELLGYYHREKTNQLKTVSHPIQAWYVTATRGNGANTAGMAFAVFKDSTGTGMAGGALPGVTTQNEIVDDPRNDKPVGCADAPHFTSCLKSVFHNVFIVADSKALQGKDLGAVADDLVMLALSQPKSIDGCNVLPSVLDQFAKSPCPGRDPPDGLTPTDAAFLTGLYKADLEGKQAFEQDDIAGRMAQILIKAGAAAH